MIIILHLVSRPHDLRTTAAADQMDALLHHVKRYLIVPTTSTGVSPGSVVLNPVLGYARPILQRDDLRRTGS